MKRLSQLFRLAGKALRLGPQLMGRLPQAWRVYRKAGRKGVMWELRRRARPGNDYPAWVAANDTLSPTQRSRLVERVSTMASTPLISVVMPAYNPDPVWLRAAIESVRSQLYPHWELCIADDASPSQAVRDMLRQYSETDPRIKVVFRPKNGHISAASNSALEVASGAWIALMDHDDLLAEHALLCIADCIAAHPDVQLIYSDEDKIDEQGRRSDPYFKPDWNIDLFRSQNMFSHLGVLSTALVRAVGGFRLGMEGSQDWDLVLRCVERIRPEQVQHVPRVLYHWRIHAESTARSMNAKPYAAVAGERALNEHYGRLDVAARAEYVGFGYRTHYELPAPPPLVSIIIPTRNALKLMRQCVESIVAKTTYPNYEIIIVDNASDDAAALAYFETLAKRPDVRVMRDARDFNYSALNNAAVEAATGELIALVNNDIEVMTPEWLSEMVALACQPGVGAVGARLWYPDMTVQHAGVLLGVGGLAVHANKGLPRGLNGYAGRAALVQSFSAVTAACLVIRKSIYQEVGGLDEVHLKVAFNDVDLCLRVREAGYRNVWTPYAELIHHESATRGDDVAPEKRARFERETAYMHSRWADLLQRDPSYNPNLTATSEDFSYACPPRVEAL
ncbi:glycosyltransferase family 2 protein [Variovorax sp. PAMC 28711]|uniref:glycosyltransferase family 2 protein n=1 Tax=Variovorax sp. PAMC 28711 TaxID=1795631 RepID=UPI00078C7BF6|nr:glycosyltransferase family 2 protein [Variovorax sp. PAMC 28711]AMM24197.1 glycosyl transferase family 2 [Variovorax sp. PAMC 28711]